MTKKYSLLILFMFSISTYGQINISNVYSKEAFLISQKEASANIFVDKDEEISVKKVASIFADDIERVTKVHPDVRITNKPEGKNIIIIGTVGKSKIIDKLVSNKKLDISQIEGCWEKFFIKIINNPFKGVKKALVIAGSDKRGTSYGAFHVSEKMGVSPYYWWADVPVKHYSNVYVCGEEVSKSPSIKYRGIFINDEDWGLKPWASKNFEKRLGDIGPKTYSKVCELILRLRGNMLAPAMHSCTGAFYSHPESKLVADSFGIVVTTSHCEPLLINNASKWEFDIKRDGDWNYATNAKSIKNKWNVRLKEASCFENIYTLAMRGIHDAGLRGNLPIDQRVRLINKVIIDQRELLLNHISKKIENIPQIFVPYKETMDVYENGLKVPDDVTLVWVDDNYGYMKRVSNPEEQKRGGGAGVYYHLSYLGGPHDYLWLNTTAPSLMYHELMKAYNTGANKYWLLNVGDIKPAELGMKTFFDLAWNVDEFNNDKINQHQSRYLGNIFGIEYVYKFQSIMDRYYRLAWSRKPEFMGWEREWDRKEYTGLKDTEYSFKNYSEAQQRLNDYKQLSDDVKIIESQLPQEKRTAFFEMIAYPVMASSQMNRKFLMSQLNHEMAADGKEREANWAARQMEEAFDSIASLNNEYNTMLDGKWYGMMELAPGWCALYHNKPDVTRFDGVGELPVDLSVKEVRMDRCCVLNLSDMKSRVEKDGHLFNIIDGMGYDWKVLQLGKPTDKVADAKDIKGDKVEYVLPVIDNDSIEITMYTVPFFPLYYGQNTDIGISVDNSMPQVFRNEFREYSLTWNNQVLRNGAVVKMKFGIDKSKQSHTISFICGAPGMMIEKVIVDWGGLESSYLGPNINL